MAFSRAKRGSQFGMRALLALVVLVAMLVPISYYYRLVLLNRPDVFATARLTIGSNGSDSSKYLAQLDTDSFCQLVLDDPKIRSLAPLNNSAYPRDWLMKHLSVRAAKNTNLIEIQALGRSERVRQRDLQAILEATIDVIRSDAMKTNTPVTVVSTTNGKL